MRWMRITAHLIDWRRLALAAPLLAATAAAIYFLVLRDDAAADTPRAGLVDTPSGIVSDVGVQKGELARDFTGTAPDDRSVRFSDLRGAPAIINFWATWCTSCLVELPAFKAVQEEFGAERLHVLAVNAGEGAGTARGFLEELDAPAFRIAMDPTLVVSDAYGVFGLPTTVFVDADGVIRAVYTGQLTRELMREYVEATFSSTTVDEPPPRVRLVTTVARDRELEAREISDGVLQLRSKSLRCDDSYCSEPAVESFAAEPGVSRVERYLSEDPARIVVRFESPTRSDALIERMAQALSELEDPLYERELEVVRR